MEIVDSYFKVDFLTRDHEVYPGLSRSLLDDCQEFEAFLLDRKRLFHPAENLAQP